MSLSTGVVIVGQSVVFSRSCRSPIVDQRPPEEVLFSLPSLGPRWEWWHRGCRRRRVQRPSFVRIPERDRLLFRIAFFVHHTPSDNCRFQCNSGYKTAFVAGHVLTAKNMVGYLSGNRTRPEHETKVWRIPHMKAARASAGRVIWVRIHLNHAALSHRCWDVRCASYQRAAQHLLHVSRYGGYVCMLQCSVTTVKSTDSCAARWRCRRTVRGVGRQAADQPVAALEFLRPRLTDRYCVCWLMGGIYIHICIYTPRKGYRFFPTS